MKITNLEIYKLFKKKLRKDIPLPNFYNEGFLFFKIVSEDGIYGFGEPNPYLGSLQKIEKRLEIVFNNFIRNRKINNINLSNLKKKVKNKIDKFLINSFETSF